MFNKMCHSTNEEQSTRVRNLSSFLEQPSCNWEIEAVVIPLDTDRAESKGGLSRAHRVATRGKCMPTAVLCLSRQPPNPCDLSLGLKLPDSESMKSVEKQPKKTVGCILTDL